MTDPVSNNAMEPSSSPAAAGTQLSAPPGIYTRAGGSNSPANTAGKDTGRATSNSGWSRLGHPDREYDAPSSPYQTASTGTSYYHSDSVTYYINLYLSSGLVGTARATVQNTHPVASAVQQQQDLEFRSRLRMAYLMYDAPYTLHNYVEDTDRSHEERQVAGRVRFRVPYGAVEVGSSCVPLLDRPASGILLPGNDHPVSFSFASVSARRRNSRINDAGSLAVHFSAGDGSDAFSLSDADALRFGAGALPGETVAVPRDDDAWLEDDDTLLDAAAEPGHPATDDGGEMMSSSSETHDNAYAPHLN